MSRRLRRDVGTEGAGRFGSRLAIDITILGVLLLALAFLLGRARHTWYWADEGVSVGIASHSLGDIPALLRHDGSPPLYYMVLHGWMKMFGSAESQTHSLSVLFALATIPAALWAGWSLCGRRTGWFLALLAAVNPFVAGHANETRMYSLVVLLAMINVAAFLHVFVYRRSAYLAVFALSLVLLLYTHNWGLLFAFGVAVALVVCLLASSESRGPLLRDALIGFGVAGLLYLPWLPTLMYQRAHTGAPWAPRPTLVQARDELAMLVGRGEVVLAVSLGAGLSLVYTLRRPWNQEDVAVMAAAAIPVVAAAAGWAISQANTVWVFRYLGVLVPPILLLAAIGMARGGPLAVVALCVTIFFSAPIALKVPFHQKSNTRLITAAVSADLVPGDLVVADSGEVPLLHHYLPPGMRYVTSVGLVPDPRHVNQVGWREWLEKSPPHVVLPPLLDALPVGHHVLVVCVPFAPEAPEQTQFTRIVARWCSETRRLLIAEPRFRLDKSMSPPPGVTNTPHDGLLLTKHSS